MSPNSIVEQTPFAPKAATNTISKEEARIAKQLNMALRRVEIAISPVWPLQDYVAINPYAGISKYSFLSGRRFLKIFSDIETLMPLEYYAQRFACGDFHEDHIQTAIQELSLHDLHKSCQMNVSGIVEILVETLDTTTSAIGPHNCRSGVDTSERCIRPLSEYLDQHAKSDWTSHITEELSKFCAAYFDDGQSSWGSPWKNFPMFQAWRCTATIDRNIEILGLRKFRTFVSKLPHTADAAILYCLKILNVPEQLWETVLLCQAFAIQGWSAWAKYKDSIFGPEDRAHSHLTALIAMRLAYEAALAEQAAFRIEWESVEAHEITSLNYVPGKTDGEIVVRAILLRASELAYQAKLLSVLNPIEAASSHRSTINCRKLAQVAFCIDVRSERFRRQLESTAENIETIGFAGFFGLPMEFVSLAESAGSRQLPVLLQPQFQVSEKADSIGSCVTDPSSSKIIEQRLTIRLFRKAWKRFQTSAINCFAFVETTGLLYGCLLAKRSLGWGTTSGNPQTDGVLKYSHVCLRPSLENLEEQGISLERQLDMAESILRGSGLTGNFARLVVLCGHGSQTENNPLQAGLDCGACGGHSGAVNARFAALMMNQERIRSGLRDRGIELPDDTRFVAALHNTTSDSVEFFDQDLLPASHSKDLQELIQLMLVATHQTQLERMPTVASERLEDLLNRSQDWSEVRPEWGLAGNAAFVAAPREFTAEADLGGRAFLHNYDFRQDPESEVLEQIMTAPLIVAHYINMQYYASTVDNQHFGSGTKAIHNVVGRFGIFSGNGGDLQTGLPWQSLHNGKDYQHHPLRLLAVIAAPRQAIEKVFKKHRTLEHLLTNGWLNLVAIDAGQQYQLLIDQTWKVVSAPTREFPTKNDCQK